MCNNEFIHAKFNEFPKSILDTFRAEEANIKNCTTQIFPEANIVVVSINNRLFLWRYSNIIPPADPRYDASLELLYKPPQGSEYQVI